MKKLIFRTLLPVFGVLAAVSLITYSLLLPITKLIQFIITGTLDYDFYCDKIVPISDWYEKQI